MPFTFAHPAAVIPINNRWKNKFCLTGLVLGSMAPDFEYFIRFKPQAVLGHNILGFFILNLPLCFLLAYVYHYLLKLPLILHMPSPIDKWLSSHILKPWSISSVRKALIFIYSAVLGMLTHVAWDSFTHVDGMMVNLLPFLSIHIDAFGHSIAVFKLLQHGGTIVGILSIVIYLYSIRNCGTNIQTIPGKNKVLFNILIIIISTTLIFGIICINSEQYGFFNIGTIVVTIINCSFLGLLLTSFISRLWIRDPWIEKS